MINQRSFHLAPLQITMYIVVVVTVPKQLGCMLEH